MIRLTQRFTLDFKRTLLRCVAFVLMVHTLAGISILQEYMGNETIGIPPAHHFSKPSFDVPQNVEVSFHHSNEQRDQRRDLDHEHLTFCSPDILFEVFFVDSSRMVSRDNGMLNRSRYASKYSNSTLESLFRPPQIA